MNLSKDELVRLAAGMKVNKRVLERKTKNELVEFITGIQVDKCNPKQIKSAVQKVYDCVQAKRIEFGPSTDRRRIIESRRLPETSRFLEPPLGETQPLNSRALEEKIMRHEAATIAFQKSSQATLDNAVGQVEQIKDKVNILETRSSPSISRALEDEIMRHEAATIAFQESSQATLDNAMSEVEQIKFKVSTLETRMPQTVAQMVEEQRSALLDSSREYTKLLVVETVGELVDETVTRVAQQLKKDVIANVESVSRLAAQKSVDGVLNDSVKLDSVVQNAMDQRVYSVIQESLGNVNRQILDVKSSLSSLDSLSLNISSLEFENNNLQKELLDATNHIDSEILKVNNTVSIGLQNLDSKVERTLQDVRLLNESVQSSNVVTKKLIENSNTYVDQQVRSVTSEISKTLSNYNVERQLVDQELSAQVNRFKVDFDFFLNKNSSLNFVREDVVDDLLQRMRDYVRENITERQLTFETSLDQLTTRFPQLQQQINNYQANLVELAERVPTLEIQVQQLHSSIPSLETLRAAAAEDLLKRMRDFIRDNVTQRQITFEENLNLLDKSLRTVERDVSELSTRVVVSNTGQAVDDLFNRMREYIRTQFANRQLEYEPQLTELQSENQRLNRRITETEQTINIDLKSVVATTNQSVAKVNDLSQNVADISNDIVSLNETVTLAASNARTAMSLVPAVNQLSIELPKLAALTDAPRREVAALQNQVRKLEASDARLSDDFMALNNALRTQRDAINQRLEINARTLDEIRSLQNVSSAAGRMLAIEPSSDAATQQQSLAIESLENRVSELESTLVSFDARIQQLQLLITTEDRPRRKRRSVERDDN